MLNDLEEAYKNLKKFYYEISAKSKELKGNENYWKLLKQSMEINEELAKCFDSNQEALFEDLRELDAELEDEHSFSMFKEGFKLGFAMAIKN